MDGLVQKLNISSALAIKILQSCTKPSISIYIYISNSSDISISDKVYIHIGTLFRKLAFGHFGMLWGWESLKISRSPNSNCMDSLNRYYPIALPPDYCVFIPSQDREPSTSTEVTHLIVIARTLTDTALIEYHFVFSWRLVMQIKVMFH